MYSTKIPLVCPVYYTAGHSGQLQRIFIIGHDPSQSHPGGFDGGGQLAQLQNIFGVRGCAGDTGAIDVFPHGQLQIGVGHTGQWQTTPLLPLVLAIGLTGQSQLHPIVDKGLIDGILICAGEMIASDTQTRAAKTNKIFMMMLIYFFFLMKLMALYSMHCSFIPYFC